MRLLKLYIFFDVIDININQINRSSKLNEQIT